MVPKKPTSGQKVNDALKTWSVLLVGVAGLLIWHYSVVLTGIQDFILPGPLQVASAFQMQLQDPLFYEHLTITFRAAITGFFLASVIAISLGTAVSQVKVIERMIMPYVAAIQTIPKVALAPLFVIWFGYGISSKVVMSAVICFFPILIFFGNIRFKAVQETGSDVRG
jgi:NitT/TauT family transport system permease protein